MFLPEKSGAFNASEADLYRPYDFDRCIFLELFTKRPVFQGQDEINQLDTIYKYMGTPSEETWPGLSELPWYELVKPQDEIPRVFRKVFSP